MTSGIELTDRERYQNVMDFLDAHPEAKKKATELALLSRDAEDSLVRATASMELGNLIIALDDLIHPRADRESNIPHPEEAQYRWVNGAKVKVSNASK